jgi:hypothetical protein
LHDTVHFRTESVILKGPCSKNLFSGTGETSFYHTYEAQQNMPSFYHTYEAQQNMPRFYHTYEAQQNMPSHRKTGYGRRYILPPILFLHDHWCL